MTQKKNAAAEQKSHKNSLVVVESPAKARTLTKYLGKGYTVKASVGHVIDLPKKGMGVAIDDGFKPEWVVMPGKKKALDALKKAAKSADVIYLASDPDREGEAIAWHIAGAINGKKQIHRILINEITKRGVKEAMANPGNLDEDLFHAQVTRRILDRLVGYTLSPLLGRKVRRGLSAGRVQSVAMRLVCEREDEIKSFVPQEYWTIEATLAATEPPPFVAKLAEIDGKKAEIHDEQAARSIVEELEKGEYVLHDINRKERKRKPLPPFNTAKLQQDAARKLRMTAKRIMAVAQALYEGMEIGDRGPVGLITYMRTDSFRVSSESQDAAREVIKKQYGDDYLPAKPPVYKSKKSAQEAHEAIRPTDMTITPQEARKHLDKDQGRLYELIYLRFLASQMNPSILDQLQVNIENGRFLLRTTATTVKFPGFTAVYQDTANNGDSENGDKEEKEGEIKLPPLQKGQSFKSQKIDPQQHFTQPPPRYTEASLVKEMEEKGIGRPSTYAQVLSTIQDRKYAGKQDRKFYPTELGCLVTELLVHSFPKILNVAFTASMEEELDRIEEGKLEWRKALEAFWKEFSKQLEVAGENMRNVKKEREEVTDIKCPQCGKNMVVKWGRNGEFLACSGYPNCKNTSNFKREEDGTIKILPRESAVPCPFCGKKLVVRAGRKGEFIGCAGYPDCPYTSDFVRDEDGKPIPVKELNRDEESPGDGGEGANASAAAKESQKPPDCPKCGKSMAQKSGRWGPYWACTGFPDCRQTVKIDAPRKPPEPTDIECDKCGKKMLIRQGRRGEFLGCSGYPKCRNLKNFSRDEDGNIKIEAEQSTDEKCDKCGKPMAIKKGRYGPFLACTGYPDCKNIKKM